VGFAQALQQIQQIQQQQIQQPENPPQENPPQENPPQQAQTEWVLLLACDLPYLQAKVLQDWASQLPAVAASTIALLPQNPQGWWEPLCGFYRLHCLPDLEVFIAQGGRSFQGWLATQKVQPLPLANPQMLFNCNTPQDFSQI
ncbi:MAG TPA: NTP transferase domain-containing protein, partial [Allocoleopsis sp.]